MSGLLEGSLTDFFRGERPRIYLGTISVAPRSKTRVFLDGLTWRDSEKVPYELRDALIELFALPSVNTRDKPRKSDLVLDILVPDYRLGGDVFVTTDWGVLSFFWRPKVTVAARLVQIETDKIRRTFKATQALSWREFALRFFLQPFQSSPLDGDVKILLYKASTKILLEIKKTLS